MKRLLLLGLLGLTSCASLEGLDYRYSQLVMKASRGSGDCDDKAIKLSEYLKRENLPHNVTAGFRESNDYELHAWVEVYTNANRYILDPEFRSIDKNPKDMYFENKKVKEVWDGVRK